MKKIIEIVDLYKFYGSGQLETKVLNGINENIYLGEFVSIMGPSGAGKSTLLYLIGALDDITYGNINIDGKNISEMEDREKSVFRRENIGFIFQFYNLMPNLSVEENIMLPILLDNKKSKDYQEKMYNLLNTVGLYKRKKHTPKELSGGEQQRVAICRSLINDPVIILADEPTGNLDSKTGKNVLKLMEKINKEKGITIVQVTHSEEAASYSQRILEIKDGRVVKS
ncbi:ABC transporter ATP-binding protein [Herbivorax sp. ANBcel31]|uniref:ABC transporter ATP-binding protein n=1 Tax=Herbivorax sp. ANBcel31 TaxID=3069754 RepID=UPI0027B73585|nr:ABC transporter ATP-binding protein [Herbivorax sp. ANBcel31]MDQ2086414.1 ABC transporter ATP-binding protein [Herbivorax sp. ANBcel31]